MKLERVEMLKNPTSKKTKGIQTTIYKMNVLFLLLLNGYKMEPLTMKYGIRVYIMYKTLIQSNKIVET